jgi:hypothetical protein
MVVTRAVRFLICSTFGDDHSNAGSTSMDFNLLIFAELLVKKSARIWKVLRQAVI